MLERSRFEIWFTDDGKNPERLSDKTLAANLWQAWQAGAGVEGVKNFLSDISPGPYISINGVRMTSDEEREAERELAIKYAKLGSLRRQKEALEKEIRALAFDLR